MVVITAVKPLLASITLVIPPAILALATFTFMLTLVVRTVGVLPILLLATVAIVFRWRKVLITCIPRLGRIWVNMSYWVMVLLNV